MKEVTISQYAAITGYTRMTIHRMIKEDRLPAGVSARKIGEGWKGSIFIITIKEGNMNVSRGNVVKKILSLAFLILIAHTSQAQEQRYDSIVERVKNLELAQERMKINLYQSHNEFRLGTILQVLGAVAMAAGASDMETDSSSKTLLIAGASCSAFGLILQIDSHKFIGRAARR